MKNEVRATGILIKTGRGSYGYPEAVVLIKIKGRDDIYIHFQLECDLSPDIVPGTVVEVEGCVRGYYSKVNNEWEVTQYMAARKISRAKSVLEKELGVKGHFTDKHDIVVILEGEVQFAASYNYPFQSLKVDIINGRKRENIALDVKRSPRLPDVTKYNKGDIVAIYATVFTKAKEINGEKRFFENLAIQDIVRTKEADINEQETMSNKMDSVRVEKPEAEKSQDDRQFIKESREYSNRSVIETVVEGI